MSGPPCVIVADDQEDVIEAVRLLFKREGLEIVTARAPSEVESAVSQRTFDAALIDLNYVRDTTSGKEGLDLLERLLALDRGLPVIVMTAWGNVEGAVEAMRRGARDYIQKPWENARLLATMRAQIELRQLLKRSRRLEHESLRQRRDALPEFIAESRAMKPVLRILERVGPSDANVLVTGEHGTGKEIVARLLHSVSARATKAFVAVNAGGLSDGVFDSEMFGHVKGAFTDAKADRMGCFELADEGTLFLDEIGNMPLVQQAKLLRVLQTGELHPVGSSRLRHVDLRVISATNGDVRREVREGRFREDLLYRLNTVELHLPPLRDRPEDLSLLAAAFLTKQTAWYQKPVEGFEPAAMSALLEHPWPGNVRELEHVIERAVLMAQGTRVALEDSGAQQSGWPR